MCVWQLLWKLNCDLDEKFSVIVTICSFGANLSNINKVDWCHEPQCNCSICQGGVLRIIFTKGLSELLLCGQICLANGIRWWLNGVIDLQSHAGGNCVAKHPGSHYLIKTQSKLNLMTKCFCPNLNVWSFLPFFFCPFSHFIYLQKCLL